jgi:hypothetical protein
MTHGQWILAAAALLLWVAGYLLFFKREAVRWWKGRPKRQRDRREAGRKAADAKARLLDELASKYPLPGAPRPPNG